MKNQLLCLAAVLLPASPAFGDDGFRVHTLRSEHQSGATEIKVLLPDRLEKDRRYAVVYVLPVEPGSEARFGNGLLEVKKLDLHNKHGLVFVQPTFSQLPWYADHPTDPKIRQETYFLEVVVPFIEKEYPVAKEARGRLLLGFSKSGWGAFSLLLRHPETFGKAVAWDAPLNMKRPQFGMAAIVGDQDTFEKYRVWTLLEQKAEKLGAQKRLGLAGYANFGEHHQALHERMTALKIPHEYRDEKKARHTWDAGWLEPAVQFLAER
jgi:S-formylglutathione hydrolase FrmB